MDAEAAQLLLTGITGLGAVVWVVSLNFLSRCARLGRPTESTAFGEPGPATGLTGGLEVAGQPHQLLARAVAVLVQGNLARFGAVKIVEKTEDRIVFERPDAAVANQPASQWFQRVELRFGAVAPGRTRVDWLVEPASLRWLLRLGVLLQIAGLLALVAGYALIQTFVVSSPDPAVRWQTLQMLQAGHFLWPPFLCGALYRKGLQAAPAQLEALVNNLPYLND